MPATHLDTPATVGAFNLLGAPIALTLKYRELRHAQLRNPCSKLPPSLKITKLRSRVATVSPRRPGAPHTRAKEANSVEMQHYIRALRARWRLVVVNVRPYRAGRLGCLAADDAAVRRLDRAVRLHHRHVRCGQRLSEGTVPYQWNPPITESDDPVNVNGAAKRRLNR